MNKKEIIAYINSETGADLTNGLGNGCFDQTNVLYYKEHYFKVSKRQWRKKRRLYKIMIDIKYRDMAYIPF